MSRVLAGSRNNSDSILLFFSQVNPCKSCGKSLRNIGADLADIWQAVNQRLPLISEKSNHRKWKTFSMLVKGINQKHVNSNLKCNLDQKLELLFDVTCLHM